MRSALLCLPLLVGYGCGGPDRWVQVLETSGVTVHKLDTGQRVVDRAQLEAALHTTAVQLATHLGAPEASWEGLRIYLYDTKEQTTEGCYAAGVEGHPDLEPSQTVRACSGYDDFLLVLSMESYSGCLADTEIFHELAHLVRTRVTGERRQPHELHREYWGYANVLRREFREAHCP